MKLQRFLCFVCVMFTFIQSTKAGTDPHKGQVPSSSKQAPHTCVFAVGGGGVSDEMMLTFLAESPADELKVLIIPYAYAASPDKMETQLARYTTRFLDLGVEHVEALDISSGEQALDQINEANVIWINGGLQNTLRNTLNDADTRLIPAIKDQYDRGLAIVGGTSAGAAIMSQVMIGGGGGNTASDPGDVAISDGFGLWPEVIIDQHFTERTRLWRLENAIARNPSYVGIGIDEGTGVLYTNKKEFKVIGESTVTILQQKGTEQEATILQAGDVYETANLVAQPALPQGKGTFEFSGHPALKGESMRIFYHRPSGDVANMPILFVMHGINRNADTYRDNWIELSEKHKILVIVPEFTKEQFPGSRMYNYGNLRTKDGKLNKEEDWTFSLIDPIFDEAVRLSNSKATHYDLFGHSAGSQFAHRFFLFKHDNKVNRVVAANAGTYTTLDFETDFPFGLKGMGMDEEKLKSIIEKDLIVHLGEEDNDPNHRYLNVTPDAMKQGAHRLERGINFYENAKELADKLNVNFSWKVRTVPGASHNNAAMAQDIAAYLYP